jgi:hypothetical protein
MNRRDLRTPARFTCRDTRAPLPNNRINGLVFVALAALVVLAAMGLSMLGGVL